MALIPIFVILGAVLISGRRFVEGEVYLAIRDFRFLKFLLKTNGFSRVTSLIYATGQKKATLDISIENPIKSILREQL